MMLFHEIDVDLDWTLGSALSDPGVHYLLSTVKKRQWSGTIESNPTSSQHSFSRVDGYELFNV